MAHNVESMFSVRQTPWHGLGKIIQEAPTVADAIKLAGLDWKVLSRPVYQGIGDNFKQVPDFQALVRSDNDFTLSIKTDNYHPLQNDHAFDFFNPFLESKMATLETAGSLKNGKVVWVLATLNKAPIDLGGGDLIQKYLLLSNSHDGTMAVRVGFTPTRVVCNNTLTIATSEGRFNTGNKGIRIFHGSKVKENLDEVQQIVNAYDATFDATAEQYERLSKKQISSKDLAQYVNVIFDLNPGAVDEREQLRTKKQQETIVRLFENGAGSNLKSANGTYWGAYNAITEFLTHEAGRSTELGQEARLFQNWFGKAKVKNEAAFEYALAQV